MQPDGPLADIEAAYLMARDAHDAALLARATGQGGDPDALSSAAGVASIEARRRLEALPEAAVKGLGAEDRLALEVMQERLAELAVLPPPVTPSATPTPSDRAAWRHLVDKGGPALQVALEAAFAATAAALPAPGGPASRLTILARLAAEPDAARRKELFLAFEPLWRLVGGGDEDASPYRRLVTDAVPGWRAGAGALARNAAAIGVGRDDVEAWALTALAAWRAAVVEPARAAGEPRMEPWDWWWHAGAAERAVGPLAPATIREINRAVHAQCGADLDALGVRLDTAPRPGRPPVTRAFAAVGRRPRRDPDGAWTPGQTVVVGLLDDGGLDELGELMHVTGHAIHLAGIRTRPAFADEPDADALTEGFADLLAFDVAEPAWQRRWLPGGIAVPEAVALRSHHATTVLDAAWALFELRLLADPRLHPNEVWTDLTTTWLGIEPHPDWSWWAIRGQLVEEAGYMANYPLGAVLTTELRAAIRERRGDWLDGDPGWYPWVRDHLFRFGRERTSGQVVRDMLGRRPTADALLVEIARAARPPQVV